MASVPFSDLLKAAEDAGFSLCPIGTYDVRVAESEVKQASGGKDMIVVRFEILSGPHAGRKVKNNFVISPENANALGFFFRHMASLGLDSAYFAHNPTVQQVAAELVGKTCQIEVGRRVWNNEEHEDVKKIMRSSSPVPVAPGIPTTPGVPPQPVAPAPMPMAHAADTSAPNLPPF